MNKVKITTTVPKEYLSKFTWLRREGITVSDLIAIAVKLHETNTEMFYMLAYFVKKEKEAARARS